jgi:hypothetical protein
VRHLVRSAFVGVMALVSFAGIARGATITLINGDASIEPLASVDQAYPALLSESNAVIVVGHYRGVATTPEARLFAVDTVAATTGAGPLMTASPRDIVGASAVSLPAPHFAGVFRSGGMPSNMFVSSFPAMGLPQPLGFAPTDLPELDCSRSGSCALSYARVDAPPSLVIRRFVIAGGPGAIMVGGATVVSITDTPRPGQHDVAMLGAQPIVVSAHITMALARSEIRIARVPAALTSGMYTDRSFVFDGERPRVACGSVDCAVVYVNGPNLFAVRVTGGPVGEASRPEPLTAHAFNEVPGAFDVTAIADGYRVAYVRTSGGRSTVVVSDYVRGLSMADAESTTLARSNTPLSVRLASAPSSRLSLLTWVEGAGMTATAHGAVIRETPDAGPEPSGPEAGVDAGVDAIADAEASAPVVEPAIEAGVDAMAADSAMDVADAGLDARSSRDSSTRPTDRPFSGGACDCRATPSRAALRVTDALWLALALALAARRRVSARS